MQKLAIHLVAGLGLLGQITPARAEIYEWIDDANDRHFANSLDRVPKEERGSAKLVVGSLPTQSTDDSPPSTATEPKATDRGIEETQQTESNGEPSTPGWDAGFSEGWVEGYRAATEAASVRSAEPTVVVLDNSPPVLVSVPRYDPTGAYYLPSHATTVAVPFDDGASRGLTHRERIQTLRSLARGW